MNTSVNQSINFSWHLPWWLTSLLLLTVLAYFAWCYRREYQHWASWGSSKNSRSPLWSWPLGLTLLRSAVCGLLLWMMAEWSWQPFVEQTPKLFVLLDTSESMKTFDGENDSQSTRIQRVQSWLHSSTWKDLQHRFQLQFFLVHESLETISQPPTIEDASFEPHIAQQSSPKRSALGDGLLQALRLAQGEPVAGIVMASDGATTHGADLVEAGSQAAEQGLPLYLIGVGKRPLQPDLAIREVNVEPSVFLGDMLLIEVFLTRQDTSESSVMVTLKDGDTGSVLDEQAALFPSGQLESNLQLKCQTTSASLRRLAVEVSPLEKEKDQTNNRIVKDIDVRDAPIPVLLVDGHPSYEFRFLKHLLERTKQPASPDKPAFALTSVLGDADSEYVKQDQSSRTAIPVEAEDLKKFDVIILGDVPANMLSGIAFQQTLIEYVTEYGGGLLCIAGPTHMPVDFIGSPLAQLIPIELGRLQAIAEPTPFRWRPTPIGERTMALRLEATLEDSQNVWSQLPLQRWRWSGIQPTPLAQVLAMTTEPASSPEPILISQFAGAGRVAFQASNETFQWLSFHGDDLYFQRYWIQLIRWLSRNRSLQNDTMNRIQLNGKRFEPQDKIKASLHLQPNHPAAENNTVELMLLASKGIRGETPTRLMAHRVPGEPNDYVCELPQLEADEYRLQVSNSEVEVSSDPFVVVDTDPELRRLAPDETSMRQAAELSGGNYAHLSASPDLNAWIKPMAVGERQPLPRIPIWNQPWVWMVLVSMLTIEWSLRRGLGLP